MQLCDGSDQLEEDMSFMTTAPALCAFVTEPITFAIQEAQIGFLVIQSPNEYGAGSCVHLSPTHRISQSHS